MNTEYYRIDCYYDHSRHTSAQCMLEVSTGVSQKSVENSFTKHVKNDCNRVELVKVVHVWGDMDNVAEITIIKRYIRAINNEMKINYEELLEL